MRHHEPGPVAARRWLALSVAVAGAVVVPSFADASWQGASSGSSNDNSHLYTRRQNWPGSPGTIDDSFAGFTFTGATTLYFGADRTTLSTGLNLGYSGAFSLTLMSSSATARTLTLGGDITGDYGGAGSNQTVTIGNATNALNVDLGSSSRTINVATGDSLLFLNAISASGGAGVGFLKTGGGTVQFAGSASNSYSGLTTVSAGELDLNKTSATALAGSVTINGTGTLKLLQANQIASSSTVSVNSGGTLNLNGQGTTSGSNTIGTLAMGAGGTLTNGSGVPVLTVASDYTNASFGSGNAFAAKGGSTGVSSAVTINARGTANQTLSGPGLSGGSGTTPTLDYGNVRQNTNVNRTITLSYGSDATSPTLRGAVQTANLVGSPFGITGITSANGADFVLNNGGSNNYTVNYNGTAGSFTQTVGFVNNFDNVRDQTLSITAAGYRYAVGQLDTTSVDFGTVHVGDTVSARAVAVSNTATDDGYSDDLGASLGTPTNPALTASGSANVATDGSGSNTLAVSISTAAAGSLGGGVSVNFVSNPTVSGLDSGHSLGSGTVAVSGWVNNYAAATFSQSSGDGALSGGGTSYTMDLGSIAPNSGSLSAILAVLNSATGPADLLKGTFTLDAGSFALSGFDSFSNIAAGASQGGLSISLSSALGPGTYTGSFVLHPRGSNASGYDQPLSGGDVTVDLTAVVIPEPGTAAGGFALGSLLLLLRRRRTCSVA